jgi:hypothetical protein
MYNNSIFHYINLFEKKLNGTVVALLYFNLKSGMFRKAWTDAVARDSSAKGTNAKILSFVAFFILLRQNHLFDPRSGSIAGNRKLKGLM